jgi:hypothetical protein
VDPYHDLPEFDDPFAEWGAADLAAVAADALVHLLVLVTLLLVAKSSLMKKRRPRKKNLTTTARSPTWMRMKTHLMTAPKMMMRSRPLCSFHSLFGT